MDLLDVGVGQGPHDDGQAHGQRDRSRGWGSTCQPQPDRRCQPRFLRRTCYLAESCIMGEWRGSDRRAMGASPLRHPIAARESAVPTRKKATPENGAPLAKRSKKAAPTDTPATEETAAAVTRKPRKASAAADGGKPGGHDLVIVESPAKAKTINKYLGTNFKVLASYGHVRDLPRRRRKGESRRRHRHRRRLGAHLRRRRTREATARAAASGRRTPKDILAELKREAAKSNRVFLATDPDREGEAIAWHIEDELDLDDDAHLPHHLQRDHADGGAERAGPPRQDRHGPRPRPGGPPHPRPRRRLSAEQPARQEGRRAALSAGRVQSVALRLVVDREREIEAFKTEEYWKITALLAPARDRAGLPPSRSPSSLAKVEGRRAETPTTRRRGRSRQKQPSCPPGTFLAELAEWAGKKFEAGDAGRRPTAIAARAGHGRATSSRKIEQKDRAEKAAAAVHDQHAAAAGQHPAALHRRPDDADGPEAVRRRRPRQRRLGGAHHLHAYRQHARLQRGAAGGARPHRRRASADATCRRSRTSTPPARAPRRPTRRSGRPTWRTRRSASRRLGLHGDQLRLYTLIYQRFVASQMTPAVFAVTNVEVDGDADERRHGRAGLFKAQGKILKFDGYRKVLPPAGKQEDATLPPLAERQALDRLGPDRQPALHPAAAALQRGVADQGAGEGRHRPAEHLRLDHQQDHLGGARLHRGEGAPLLRHGDRQGRDRPAGRALPAA